jgi:hypothetical protein
LTVFSLFFFQDPKSITTPTDTTVSVYSIPATTKVAQSKPASKVFPAKNLAAALTHTDFHTKLLTVTEPVAVPEPTTLSFSTAAVTVKSKPTVKLF